MNVLVTGGSGFIGSNLCKFLLAEGYFVYCMDNNYSSSIKNIEKLLDHSNFEFINWDIREPIDLSVDQIYNLACPASPKSYQSNAIYTMMTNVQGTYNILDLAKKNDAVVVQASTSEVYGDPKVSPQKESYWGNVNPVGVRSCYDEGKRAAETLVMDFNRIQNLDARIVRIFNTYGPGMEENDGRVVSNFICQALRNNPITIYGDGTQTRSFCYVDDLVMGLFKMMQSSRLNNGPINLGNSDEFMVSQLATKVLSLTGSSSKIVFEKLPSDDPKNRRPDIELANKYLDWSPICKLDEGLSKTIEYFKNVISNKD